MCALLVAASVPMASAECSYTPAADSPDFRASDDPTTSFCETCCPGNYEDAPGQELPLRQRDGCDQDAVETICGESCSPSRFDQACRDTCTGDADPAEPIAA